MSAPNLQAPKSIRTPLARVRGLGASHSGTSDFWRQRLTAVAMVLLILPVMVVVLRLPEATVRLHSDAGVFARGAVDSGTMFLLRRAPSPPLDGDILDLGTGYGPIAVTLGLRSPQARVWAVDINHRALELTARNAARAGVDNVVAATPDEVPGSVRFAAIYSNPPVRIGLALLHPLLTAWLDRLHPGAVAHLVVHRHLGSDSLARWLAAQGFGVERVASHDGYRILSVHPRPVVGDDR